MFDAPVAYGYVALWLIEKWGKLSQDQLFQAIANVLSKRSAQIKTAIYELSGLSEVVMLLSNTWLIVHFASV